MRITLLVICLVACASAQADDQYDIKVYPLARANHTITIDGALDEACWERSLAVRGFTQFNKPELMEVQATIRLLYDDRFLYFGLDCDEPNMDKVTPVDHARDSRDIFHGETIEIFVDPDHTHSTYYQFGINAAASVYDSIRSDVAWSADVRAATELGETGWTLEVAIPWADMGATPEPGKVIGFNVCRDRYAGADKEWMNWSQTKANFHDPLRFAHAVLSPDAQRLGALEAEYRKGGRSGAILFLGLAGLTEAAYRALSREALVTSAESLAQMEGALEAEGEQGAREELARRIAEYREELAGFADQVESGKPLGTDEWKRMTLRLAQMLVELDRVVWEARLSALISTL